MKNIKAWLVVMAIFIVLILPGIAALWKAIIFNILPDAGVVLVCCFMFVFGCIAMFVSLDYLLNNRGEKDGGMYK